MSNPAENEIPSVSVVIPTLHGDSQDLDRLRSQVLNAGFPPDSLEIIAVIGVSPNGRARDVGAVNATGEYLLFMDDDVSFPRPSDLLTVIEFLDQHADVGLAGPAQQIPGDLPEPHRSRALQRPRTHVKSPEQFMETDMVTHACLALRRQLFMEIGMEHPNLISGTDPDLRNRVRKQGLKVGVVPDTRVEHPPVQGWNNLLKKSFVTGRRSRSVRRTHPDYHLDAEPEITETTEPQGIGKRLQKHGSRFLKRLVSGDIWAWTAQVCYLLGYGWERISPKQWVDPIPYPAPPSPTEPGWDKFKQQLKEEGDVQFLHPETPQVNVS